MVTNLTAQGNLQFNRAITYTSNGNDTYTVPEGKVWKITVLRAGVPTLTFGATTAVGVKVNGIALVQKTATGTSSNTASYCSNPTQPANPAYVMIFDEFANSLWLEAGSVISTFLISPPTQGGTTCMGTTITGVEFNLTP